MADARRIGCALRGLLATLVAVAPMYACAQDASAPISSPRPRGAPECVDPQQLTALPGGDYQWKGANYAPAQLIDALKAASPRPMCLKVQGERQDAVLGDRMYWLMREMSGVVVSWPPPPRTLCASSAPGFAALRDEACASLPASEFAPLTAGEFQDLRRAQSTLSGCVLRYQVDHRGLTGSISDIRIQKRLAKDGVLPAMKADVAAYFPALAPAASPDGKLASGDVGDIQGLSWALVSRATQQGRLLESLQADALFTKYMAMGTEGACAPSDVFTRLLQKSKPQ